MPWLGEVPDHWKCDGMAVCSRQRNETGFADLPILEVSLKTACECESLRAPIASRSWPIATSTSGPQRETSPTT